jgi:hypothetical protein
MKKKTFVKKLSLDKVTISNLSQNTLSDIKGGVDLPFTHLCKTLFECSAVFCDSLQNCPDSQWLYCTDYIC